MTEQPDRKTLSLKKTVPLDSQAVDSTPLAKRSKKRIIRRGELAQSALGRTKLTSAPQKAVNKKVKSVKVLSRQPAKTPPSDLRMVALDQQLHDAFTVWHDYQPLALGIDKSIFRFIAEQHISASKRVVQKLLQRHTSTRSYRGNILRQAQRYDLDGSPAGQISQIEKDHAQRQIDVAHSAEA